MAAPHQSTAAGQTVDAEPREVVDGLQVVVVNKKYRDAKGNRFDHHAAPGAVAEGWFVNRPVLLRKPNGKLVQGNEVLVTPRGMEMLQREVPLEIRDVKGPTQ